MHGKETVYLYPGLAHSGGLENFFLIFLQDRKSTSLLTVIKTLAQIPRKKTQIFCLTMDISANCAKGKGKKGEELHFFFVGVHHASAEAQHKTLFLGLLLFPSAPV